MGILAIGLIAGASGCKKKEGCTDINSDNYDPSAEKDDGSCIYSNNGTIEIGGQTYHIITGTESGVKTLTSDKRWYLSGGYFIEGTLNVEAGVTVYAANDGTVPFIAVQRGGKINANGTASLPIVMTTIKTITGGATSGDWGGVVLNGYGELNICGSLPCEAQGEGGSGIYGGTDNNDDSGTMSYVRVEYAGKLLGTDNEMNGFSFNGVGSSTVLHHLQAFMGNDDGFEFFGGATSLKYAVSTGNSDDSFDWTHGWKGFGQYWVVQQSTFKGDRGLEADNWETDHSVSPFSEPTLSNLTLIGAEDGDSSNTGMRLRHGTKGHIYNALVTGFPKHGVRVSNAQTTNNMNDGSLEVFNTTSYGNTLYGSGANWKDCDPFKNEATNSDTDPGVLNGYVGIDPNNSIDPTSLDGWFDPGSFKGAVESGNDWTQGWTRML